jgi:hypothetical protein
VYGEVHDHDNIGKEDEEGGVGFGDKEVVEELDVLAVVMIEVLGVGDLPAFGLELLHLIFKFIVYIIG